MATTLLAASVKASMGMRAGWGTAPASNTADPEPYNIDLQFSSGTANGQVDRWHASVLSIADGDNTTLDLRSLTDADGTSIVVAEVVALCFDNSGSTTAVQIGNSGASQFNGFFNADTDVIVLQAGGKLGPLYLGAAGIATSSSNKDLKFTNAGGGSVALKVWILGRSA